MSPTRHLHSFEEPSWRFPISPLAKRMSTTPGSRLFIYTGVPYIPVEVLHAIQAPNAQNPGVSKNLEPGSTRDARSPCAMFEALLCPFGDIVTTVFQGWLWLVDTAAVPRPVQSRRRTVVFRGFLRSDHLASAAAMSAPADGSDSEEESLAGGPSPEGSRDSCIIILVTDSRSQKVRHARASFPKAPVEICWWLDEAAVQFRIAGRALVVDHSTADSQLCAVRAAVWNRLRASTRETFRWPEPGQPRDDVVVSNPGELRMEDAHFAVFLVLPSTVDELQLGGRQRRRIHKTAPLPE
ncbi:PPOX2, partial [Symbiodinium necroappetens]